MHPTPASWTGYLIFGVALVVLVLRIRGMQRVRRLRLETLWVVPAVLAGLLALMIVEGPSPSGRTWLWLALASIAGAVIGWRRGKLMTIHVDPVTHALNQQASPTALLFAVVLIVARHGLRFEAASLGLDILQVTRILPASAVGLVAAMRAEMYVRARRLLAEARAQAGAGSSIGPISAR